jgi:hypothetical protein
MDGTFLSLAIGQVVAVLCYEDDILTFFPGSHGVRDLPDCLRVAVIHIIHLGFYCCSAQQPTVYILLLESLWTLVTYCLLYREQLQYITSPQFPLAFLSGAINLGNWRGCVIVAD